LTLFRWYHWVIFGLICFFNGAGMCATWKLLSPQSDAENPAWSSVENDPGHKDLK
jgi:hypothetical protein